MEEKNRLISIAKTWTGYLEKASNKDLNDFTANAGKGNYTCFARDYKEHTGLNLQAQPWCAMYVSEVFTQVFGLEKAKKMLNGLFHYCPTGVQQFKQAGRWSKTPEPGAVIFFTNGNRAYHTGIVVEVTANRVKTVEGNTSGASGVVENGGGVFQKSYNRNDTKIMGYGIPDWKIAKTYIEGFKRAADGVRWWYQNEDGSYCHSGWHWLKEVTSGTYGWYLFDEAGYMLKGYQTDPLGRKVFLCPDAGVHEGKCMVTDDQGVLKIAPYDTKLRKYII